MKNFRFDINRVIGNTKHKWNFRQTEKLWLAS